uniref:Uncharacterized protein n=1 Tax=Chromera velia CCMP2878 TaxID=1169474 RepID=A0A0G4HK59_9ALVE|eukprot:Cvel_7190.t1-p1 / transcript=Cvel_7190.t1 / gene=Cvel_7190 / organism=Chromera_velia_CCMP2878 / gene_product=hypothetical protein / transcript_product=hypothetical protein / location=Cvel_scaffold369:92627-92971(+) / protein_length=115 / sequence_SO=supercontig / SO=protein_coding / is_pseudo=false
MWEGHQSGRYGGYGRLRCDEHNGEGKGGKQRRLEWERMNDGSVDCTLGTSQGEYLVQPTKDTPAVHERLCLPGLLRDEAVRKEARETMGGGGTNREKERERKRERMRKNPQTPPY